ncbi:MAG: antirestriction protein ArdA [Pseudomonadota bacterium]
MTTLFAQPYDLSATGFYFEDTEDYAAKAATAVNSFGHRVEEFEIQLIDSKPIVAALADALGLHQGDIPAFFEKIDSWDDHQKRMVIIAAGECGYQFTWDDDPDTLDVEIYEMASLCELAEHFVDEGLFGDIPGRLTFYIDHDAIARDLSADYAETKINRSRLIYRCG